MLQRFVRRLLAAHLRSSSLSLALMLLACALGLKYLKLTIGFVEV